MPSLAVQVAVNSQVASAIAAIFASNNAAGNSIVAVGIWDGTGTTSTISDSQGNTYTSIGGPTSGNGEMLQCWLASNINAGANTVIMVAGNSFPSLVVLEYPSSMGLTAANVDQFATAGNAGSTAYNSGPVTTTANAELLIGYGTSEAVGPGATFTAGSGWALEGTQPDGSSGGAMFVEDQLVASTGTFTATATCNQSGRNDCCIVTIKVTAAGPITQSFAAATAAFAAKTTKNTHVSLPAATAAFAGTLKKFTHALLGAATHSFAATLGAAPIFVIQFAAATAAFSARVAKKTFVSLSGATASFAVTISSAQALFKSLLARLQSFAASVVPLFISGRFQPNTNQLIMLRIINQIQMQGIHVTSTTIISTVVTYSYGRGFNNPTIEQVTADWVALLASGLVPPNVVIED